MPRRSELAEDKGGCCETADQLLHSQTSALDKFACVLLVIDSRCLGAVSEVPQTLALLLCEWGPSAWDADPEFDEPAGEQWLVLLPKKWNPKKKLLI